MTDDALAALAHVRHELRTPLGHIIGYSEMLLEEVEDGGAAAVATPLRALHADARHVLAG
jgi:signal transduction histidine kinase